MTATNSLSAISQRATQVESCEVVLTSWLIGVTKAWWLVAADVEWLLVIA